MVTARSF